MHAQIAQYEMLKQKFVDLTKNVNIYIVFGCINIYEQSIVDACCNVFMSFFLENCLCCKLS